MKQLSTTAQIYECKRAGASRLSIFNLSVILLTALLLTPGLSRADSDSTIVAKSNENGGIRDSTAAKDVAASFSSVNRRLEPGVFDMITNLRVDWRDWAVENIQWKYWPEMAAITASTAVMIVYDNPMWQPFKKIYESNTFAHNTSDMFVFMGDGKFQFGLAAALAGYGVVAGDQKALRTASQTVEVILACGGVVQLLKHLTGRESPFVSTSSTGVWRFFPNQIDYLHHTPRYDAFPSGHLATATATLTVIANNYPDVTWIKPVGYVCLAGISLGLVASGIHWWSDFPLALALGYGFGTLVSPNPDHDVSVVDPPSKNIGATKVVFYPSYAEGSIGVGMNVQW